MPFANPLPASLSPSRLQDFQSCPRKYQHSAVDRIAQPASYATLKGIFFHAVLERLFDLPPEERTIEAARGFVDGAAADTLTPERLAEAGCDDDRVATMHREIDQILTTYFSMEDPRTVDAVGVEMKIGEQIDGTPVYGILDRLDRLADGTLTIVDYKTGSVPNRDYDSQTFANAELYAALCEAGLGERPTQIRLLYVAKGQELLRTVTEPVVNARRDAAGRAWTRINRYYQEGEFPAKPSRSACRFCAYKDRCRSAGVDVPA
jgi:putative RecB family exonuclease